MLQEPSRRRVTATSLPGMTSACSSFSDSSVHQSNIAHRFELQQYEERLEVPRESKLDAFRKEVRELRLSNPTLPN